MEHPNPTAEQKIVIEASRSVWKWSRDQANVGEESLSDWLLYTVSKQLPNVVYKKFTRAQEARTTGADWEWWFVGSQNSIGLRIQAKRVRPGMDNTPALRYRNRHGFQISKLLADAKAKGLLPLYCFYYHGPTPTVLCRGLHDPGFEEGIFLASAGTIHKNFYRKRRRAFTEDLLSISNPLACIFCCPWSGPGLRSVDGIWSYLQAYYSLEFQSEPNDERQFLHSEPPPYVLSMFRAQEDLEAWPDIETAAQLRGLDALIAVRTET